MSKLSGLTDYELIIQVKNDANSSSFDELVDRHDQLYYSVVNKFCLKHPEANREDLLSDLYIVINEAINKYNPDKKTKFSTFLYYWGRFHCLNSYKKIKHEVSYQNSDIDLINEKNNKYYTFSENLEEINNYVFKILEKMNDKRISRIFHRRFIDIENNKLTSWSKIGTELNLSTTMIITLFYKGQKFLYRNLNKEKNKII